MAPLSSELNAYTHTGSSCSSLTAFIALCLGPAQVSLIDQVFLSGSNFTFEPVCIAAAVLLCTCSEIAALSNF